MKCNTASFVEEEKSVGAQEMYNHLQRMSLRFFTNTKAGDIISRFTNDVSGAQSAITGTVPDIVTNVVVLVSTLVVMLTIEWRLTLLSMLVVPLFLIPARRIAGVLRGIRRQSMEYNAAMTNIVNETLTINGALLVKTFGSGSRESARFEDANRRTAASSLSQFNNPSSDFSVAFSKVILNSFS